MEENKEVFTNNSEEIQEKNNSKEYNFSQLRKQLEKEREESRLWKEKASLLEKEKLEKESSFEEDSEDMYVDGKKLHKKFSDFEGKVEKKINEIAERKARSLYEEQKEMEFLKNHPDFEQILQEGVLKKFVEKFPEVAQPLTEMPHSFARQRLLYQNIKALGVHRPEEERKSIQDTVNKNLKGPFYRPSDVSASPYSAMGDFSSSGQKTAYEKMQELKSRLRI